MKVLYFSTVNWRWIKQRPHFICEQLSKKNVNLTYISLTPFLKQRIIRKKLNDNLIINDKYVLPYSSKFDIVKKINIRYIKYILNKKYDVVIITHPEQYDYLPKQLIDNAKIIYECMDNIPYFYEDSKRIELEDKEKNICKKVNGIITSSNYLQEKIVKKCNIEISKVKVIKNALDISLIKKDHSIVQLNSPNLIYIGTISNWLDIDLLNEFAQDNPHYTIYIIGPIEKKICTNKSSNIVFLGAIAHEEVKKYIESGEIMLIPFKINELINGVDPVKLYEYLAFNKPVVTSYWRELECYKNNELVHFYNNYEEFCSAIKNISTLNYGLESVNYDFIDKNIWDNRAEIYMKFLENIFYLGE